MDNKKEILLKVKTDMGNSDKSISKLVENLNGLNQQVYALQLSQKALKDQIKVSEQAIQTYNDNVKAGRQNTEEQTRAYEQAKAALPNLQRELTITTEALKANKKEAQEQSRQIQNTIISQETYKDTLKGMAAQLSVEKDKLRQIKIAGGELTDEYKRQQEVVNQLNTKVSTLEQAYGVYTRNVGNYKSGVQELNEMLRQHLQRLGTLKEGTKEWDAEASAVQKTTRELENLNREQEKQEATQQGFFTKAKAGWTAMVGWIAAVVAAVTGLIRAVSKVIKTNIEFAQQQKNLQTILGLTNDEMQAMTNHAKELGRTTEYTASQVTELQIALAKLGFTAEQIRAMSGAVLALATDLDAGLGESADLTGSVLRQFGKDASEAGHVVDVLVKGANESALSFDKYRTALAQVAPVANAMGFDLEGVVSILGSLVNVGMDASMAANSTRNILLKLADSSSDLAKSLSQPVKDIPSLVAGLKELQDRGIDVAEALELTDKRSVAAFTSLMKNADAIDELNKKLADVDGYAIGIREERLQTTEGAIKMLKSAWEGFELAVLNSEGRLSKFFRGLADDINILTDRLDPEGKARRDFEALVQNFTVSYEEIAKVAEEKGINVEHALQTMYETETRSMQERANEQQRIIKSMNHQISATEDKREKKRLEQIKANAEIEINTIRNNYQALKQAYEKIQKAREKASGTAGSGGTDDGGTDAKVLSDAEKKKASQVALKELESNQKVYSAMLAQQKRYYNDASLTEQENEEQRWQHEQEWQKRSFEQKQSYEREKLRIQLQYDQITGEEYRNGLKALEIESETFYKDQEQNAIEHMTSITEKVTKALSGVDLGVEIKAVKEQYQELYAGLDAMVKNGLLTYEEASYYRVGLEQKEAREIKAIRERSKKEEEKRLQEEAQKRAEKLNTDLKLAWQNAEQQYQIRKRYLEQEMELYKASAAKRAELEQQLAALESEHMQAKIDRMNEYLTQVGEMFGSMNTIATNYSNTRVQEAEQQNEQEKAALDKRLKSGLMSQKQYDDKVAKLDADLAAKKAEETRKQAERQKALSVFEIALNTATAIMKIWAEVPKMDFGVSTVALTAVAAAMGALQLGAVLSEPLPKARKGGKIKGAKHEQGGVLVETEGEERIVAAEPAKAYPELLNLISYIGKKKGGKKSPLEPSMTSATESEERMLLDRNKRIVEQNEKVTQINRSNTLLDSIIRGSEILPGSNNDIRFRLGDVIRETDIRHLAMDEVRNSSMDNIISNVTRYGAIPDTGYALRYSEAQARAGASGQVAGNVEIDYERLGEVVAQRVGEEIKNLQVWLSLTELRDAQDNVVHLDELTRQ
jgi:TP901 family phage tail tape measure protein